MSFWKSFRWQFPEVKKDEGRPISDQLDKIAEELREAREADNVHDKLIEAWDIIQAAETYIRRIVYDYAAYYGDDIAREARNEAIRKNAERGYYGGDFTLED